ncbi:MAG: FAD-binding oxidoreductase [Xanthomonadaceae bacterium]|nr:FAD-binding oxidoreductase [Xanthomonadaceae bacterium]
MSGDTFFKQLDEQFAKDFYTREPSELAEYGKDWTKVFLPNPCAIAFPRSAIEVSKLVKLCVKNKVAIVPSGGRTGLAGGAVAPNGEIVLSLKRMNKMQPVNPTSLTVRVEAGAVTQAVHEHCAPEGLTWPVDFASKGSSTIGGNISTNAGGVKVIRYGLTRNWVLGLQVVTMNGDIIEFNGDLEKNNSGTDLRQLFIGTEGTLGIITEATLKLARLPGELDVFFFGLKSIPDVLKLFTEARRGPFTLNAFETFTDNCLKAVLNHRKMYSPLTSDSPCYVLMEVERATTSASKNEVENWLASLFDRELVCDGVLAQTPREATDIWTLREGIAESLAAINMNHKHDVSVPIAKLEPFIAELSQSLKQTYKQFNAFVFGHIGDGNLHFNVVKPNDMSKEDFLKNMSFIDQDLFKLIQKYSGSVSAEHGIGLLKKKALHYTRTSVEMVYLKSIKKVFDPENLLNPGKIFDL